MIRTVFLICCMIASQNVCFADYEDVQVNSGTGADGRETTTYMGGTENDRDVAKILKGMNAAPTEDLVKYVFMGTGSGTAQFSIADSGISTKTELMGYDTQQTRLNVKLLDENNRAVKTITRSVGRATVYGNLSVKDGEYTLKIFQDGPGDWEISLIVPESTYFSSSDYESEELFYEPE